MCFAFAPIGLLGDPTPTVELCDQIAIASSPCTCFACQRNTRFFRCSLPFQPSPFTSCLRFPLRGWTTEPSKLRWIRLRASSSAAVRMCHMDGHPEMVTRRVSAQPWMVTSVVFLSFFFRIDLFDIIIKIFITPLQRMCVFLRKEQLATCNLHTCMYRCVIITCVDHHRVLRQCVDICM